MKKSIVIISLLALVSVAAWVYQVRWLRAPVPAPSPTDDGKSIPPRPWEVRALGRLEPADGVLDIIGPPGDRVAQLLITEGEVVKAAKPLVILESQTARQFETRTLESQIVEAKAKLESERSLARSRLATAQLAETQANEGMAVEIAAQQAQLEALQAALAQSEKDLERFRRLAQASPELVSQQELELQELRARKAMVEVLAAEASLARLKQSSGFKKEIARNDRAAAETALSHIDAANPLLSLQSQLEFAKFRLSQTSLVSPTTGTVLRLTIHQGEMITQRPLMQIADLTRMVCIAEVYDDQIQDVSLNQEVALWTRALGGTPEEDSLQGRVRSKRRIVAAPELKPLDPFAPSDRHVIEVIIDLDESNSRRASEFVHLQVDVVFKISTPSKSDAEAP